MKAGKFIGSDDIFPEPTEMAQTPCFGGNGRRGYVRNCNHDGEFSLIGRQGALCGNVQHVQGKFYATEHAVVVQSPSISSFWLYFELTFLQLNRLSTGAAQPGLSVENIENVKIIIPSRDQQNMFVQFAHQSDKSKSSVEKLEKTSFLLEISNFYATLFWGIIYVIL